MRILGLETETAGTKNRIRVETEFTPCFPEMLNKFIMWAGVENTDKNITVQLILDLQPRKCVYKLYIRPQKRNKHVLTNRS